LSQTKIKLNNKSKERLSILLILIISIILIFVIKDINKYRIFIRGTCATFLISMGIIVFNIMKFNVNKVSIFLAIVFFIIGILQIIYVVVSLNNAINSTYIYNFTTILSMVIDLLPIIGIYMSFNYLRSDKNILKNVLIIFISSILFITSFLIFKDLSEYTNKMLIKEEIIIYIDNIITMFIIIMSIFINDKIKKADNKLNDYERYSLKSITIMIITSRVPTVMHIFVGNLYIEDVLKQIISNVAIYYLYKYIVHINVKIPYIELNEINNVLINKSKNLNDKNRKLIDETSKIEELKKMLNRETSKLQSTLDLSTNCIIVLNSKKEVTYLNKVSTEKFSGNYRNEDYELERDMKPFLENYDDFIETIDYAFEFNKNIQSMIYTKDNKAYQVICTPIIIKNEKQGTLCILIDKTKKKEFKQKVIDINTRYERFLENIGDAIIVVEDGKKIYANEACKEIFKNKLDEIDFNIDYNNDNIEECYEIEGKKVYVEMSFSEYTKNNENKTIIVIRDITDRKKAKLKLKESQKSYKRLIDILPDGICLLNKNLEITYANQSLLNMLNIKDANNIKLLSIKNIIDLSLDEDSKFDRNMKNVINKTEYVLLLEYELITSDKNKIQVEVNALPFSIDENKNIMLIIKDLTHKKTSEIVEKELSDRLKIDKVKTEFFANMSHELKTPLNVISSSNQLIDSLYKNNKIDDYNDNMKSHIELVRQSSYRLQRLITNIIDLTKMESGFYKIKLSKYNIVNIVEDLFMKIDEYAMKKNLSIIFDTDNEEINVNIDKVEIERIILNLLSNCIKYTSNGGCIFINIYDKKDNVIISVKDNGVGIPKNKIDIIFDEFTQVDRTLSRGTEGSGIGLTIVRNLVELHKGSISVNSEEGKGTEFIINLPIVHLSYEDCEEDKRIYNIDEKIKIEFSDIYY
jgi:PAS domain S-box-containing protein